MPTPKGKHMLMVNEYTFSQKNNSTSYYCSKKDSGCKARIRLDATGKIVQADVNHTHDPPKYVVLANGKYVKI